MHTASDRSITTVWVNARFLERPVTGVERVAHELLGALAADGLDADGCWREGDRRLRLRLLAPADSAAESPWPNLPLVRAGAFGGHLWEQLELPRLTRGDWLLSLCNTGPILKRRHILYLHDAQPFAIPENFSRTFRVWYRILFHAAGRIARCVLVNSRFTRQELRRHVGLPGRKLQLCRPGSEHVRRDKTSDSVLARFALPEQPFLLAVASANPNKNFAGVLRALEALGDKAPPCVIVGRTDQRHFAGVKLDPGRVTHLGYVSDRELLALYRRALALVFPSFYEGFGLPPLEAMAAGCPVITSRTSAMPEVCGDAAEYCDPGDTRSLVRAIRRIGEVRERRETMTQRGLARAGEFSWRDSAAKLRGLIVRQATGRGLPGGDPLPATAASDRM